MSTKLAAFTIVELMAVLLLSAIIFGATLLVIQITQQQEQNQEKEHEEVLKMEQLATLLQQDVYQSKGMYREQQQLLFDYETYSIRYAFGATNVLRTILNESDHCDTFRLPTIALESNWERQSITVGKIDYVFWESRFFEQPYRIALQKSYDHKTLLEQNYSATINE